MKLRFCNDHHLVETFISIFLPSGVAYKQQSVESACCLENENVHQRCQCSKLPNVCKSYCDGDTSCKGYVELLGLTGCEIATTSTCPNGCNQYNVGNIGDLDENVTCENPDNYGGCFIIIG